MFPCLFRVYGLLTPVRYFDRCRNDAAFDRSLAMKKIIIETIILGGPVEFLALVSFLATIGLWAVILRVMWS